jgi:predicted nucleic acid-binding protein
METYGYSRGSLSKAATAAILGWIRTREISGQVAVPDEPVKSLRGLLRHVKKSSVELQHEAAQIRAESTMRP